MCGRMFQTLPLARLMQIARTSKVSNSQMHTTSYNVCPTTYIPVIKNSPIYQNEEKEEDREEKMKEKKEFEGENEEDDEQSKQHPNRQVSFMKWGAQTNFNMIINGRIQELTSKKTFVNIIENRCVVIMEGYFQWQQKPQQKQKQPYCFKSKKQDHFLVAGLYTPNNEIVILTKDAIPSISHIHERMPVILSQKQVQLWLDPKNTQHIHTIISKSLLDKEKAIWKNVGFAQVAPHVNKIAEKSVKCIMSMDQYKKELSKNGIMKFFKKKPEKVEVIGKDGQILEQKEQKIEKEIKSEKLDRKNVLSSSKKSQKKMDEEKIETKKEEKQNQG